MDKIYCVSLSLTIDMFLLIARIYLISFITNLPIKRTSNISSVEYIWWKMLLSRQDNKKYGLFLLCVGSRKFKACWKFIFIMIMQRWKMRSLLYFFIFLYYFSIFNIVIMKMNILIVIMLLYVFCSSFFSGLNSQKP